MAGSWQSLRAAVASSRAGGALQSFRASIASTLRLSKSRGSPSAGRPDSSPQQDVGNLAPGSQGACAETLHIEQVGPDQASATTTKAAPPASPKPKAARKAPRAKPQATTSQAQAAAPQAQGAAAQAASSEDPVVTAQAPVDVQTVAVPFTLVGRNGLGDLLALSVASSVAPSRREAPGGVEETKAPGLSVGNLLRSSATSACSSVASAAVDVPAGEAPPLVICRVEDDRFMSHSRDGEAVWLHIYDVAGNTARALNNLIRPVGTGAFHAGVEVFRREWSFGFAPGGRTGVHSCQPRCTTQHVYRESVFMGKTMATAVQVQELIDKLKVEWLGCTYDLLVRNCCHFSDTLCRRLGVGPVPEWVISLAGAGAAVAAGVEEATATADAARGLAAAINEEITPAMDELMQREWEVDEEFLRERARGLMRGVAEMIADVSGIFWTPPSPRASAASELGTLATRLNPEYNPRSIKVAEPCDDPLGEPSFSSLCDDSSPGADVTLAALALDVAPSANGAAAREESEYVPSELSVAHSSGDSSSRVPFGDASGESSSSGAAIGPPVLDLDAAGIASGVVVLESGAEQLQAEHDPIRIEPCVDGLLCESNISGVTKLAVPAAEGFEKFTMEAGSGETEHAPRAISVGEPRMDALPSESSSLCAAGIPAARTPMLLNTQDTTLTFDAGQQDAEGF